MIPGLRKEQPRPGIQQVDYTAHYAEPENEDPIPIELIPPSFDARKRVGDLCYAMGQRWRPLYHRVTCRRDRRMTIVWVGIALALGLPAAYELAITLRVIWERGFWRPVIIAAALFAIAGWLIISDARKRGPL